jgi:hypothetical protein
MIKREVYTLSTSSALKENIVLHSMRNKCRGNLNQNPDAYYGSEGVVVAIGIGVFVDVVTIVIFNSGESLWLVSSFSR